MKRIIALVLLLLAVLLASACRAPAPDDTPVLDDTPDPVSTLTVEQAVAAFDGPAYFAQVYDETMIDPIRQKLELEGNILAVVHVTNQNTAVPTLEWAYIYEFSDEQDAVWFEQNRRTFVSGQEGGGSCIRSGCVVVYGNSAVIDTLGQ